jgi:hypothetical protein
MIRFMRVFTAMTTTPENIALRNGPRNSEVHKGQDGC